MKKNIYLDKNTFKEHLKESKKLGYMTDTVARDLILLADRMLTGPKFKNYDSDLKEDMKAHALSKAVKYFDRFDLNKCDNPFSYFTYSFENSFRTEYYIYMKYYNKKERYKNMIIENMLISNPENSKIFINNIENIKNETEGDE